MHSRIHFSFLDFEQLSPVVIFLSSSFLPISEVQILQYILLSRVSVLIKICLEVEPGALTNDSVHRGRAEWSFTMLICILLCLLQVSQSHFCNFQPRTCILSASYALANVFDCKVGSDHGSSLCNLSIHIR
jgi:hypothetical protein